MVFTTYHYNGHSPAIPLNISQKIIHFRLAFSLISQPLRVPPCRLNGGFHKWGGTPKWMVYKGKSENPNLKWMMTGWFGLIWGCPYFRKPPNPYVFCYFHNHGGRWPSRACSGALARLWESCGLTSTEPRLELEPLIRQRDLRNKDKDVMGIWYIICIYLYFIYIHIHIYV